MIRGVIIADSLCLVIGQASPQWGEGLTMAGILASVLGWFMFRLESELKASRASMDRLARAQLILVIALKQAPESAKEEARVGIKEIDDSQKKP